jgi:TonB family protein
MKAFWACLLVSAAVFAHSQTPSKSDDAPQSHPSIADFGLAYPLSNDWVRATQLSRRKDEPSTVSNFDILLAAVYVPKSHLSTSSPFFTLRASHHPADCKKSLEAMIARSPDKKKQPEGGVEEFSVAGRNYFRVNMTHGLGGRHLCVICTMANGHLLVWNAGAPNEKGMDAIVSTLNSITALPQRSAAESTQSAGQKNMEESLSKLAVETPERVNVANSVTSGLKIKDVAPIYPSDARAAYIQGTVLLRAEISKAGDITDLELIDGPIELAGSAVAAVRQWKYKPYRLNGEPVTVDTQIQVNYELR